LPDLTKEALDKLLARLDADPSKAVGRYQELREKLVYLFEYELDSNIHADSLADEAIDRVARKLLEGVEIKKINSYTYKVAFYVLKEHRRKDKEKPMAEEEIPEQIVEPEFPEDPNELIIYLRKCRGEVSRNEKELRIIKEYFETEPGEKPKDARKRLAEELKMTSNHLKKKACQLRKLVERCITECLTKNKS
jgi:DNA-directed RNA polymerase specialized sigma24 family protein